MISFHERKTVYRDTQITGLGIDRKYKGWKNKKEQEWTSRQTTQLHLNSHLEILWWKNNCSFFKPCDLWSWISFNLAFKLHCCTIWSMFGLQFLHESRGRWMLTWSQLCRNYKAKNTGHLYSFIHILPSVKSAGLLIQN